MGEAVHSVPLVETLDVLSDPGAMRDIRRAERDIDGGEALSADELRATYLGH